MLHTCCITRAAARHPETQMLGPVANGEPTPNPIPVSWYTVHHRACMQQLSVWGRGALEVLRPQSIRRFTVPTRAK